jgi:hypothetical protein
VVNNYPSHDATVFAFAVAPESKDGPPEQLISVSGDGIVKVTAAAHSQEFCEPRPLSQEPSQRRASPEPPSKEQAIEKKPNVEKASSSSSESPIEEQPEQSKGCYPVPTSLYERSLQKRNFGYDVRVRKQPTVKSVPSRRQGSRPTSPKPSFKFGNIQPACHTNNSQPVILIDGSEKRRRAREARQTNQGEKPWLSGTKLQGKAASMSGGTAMRARSTTTGDMAVPS